MSAWEAIGKTDNWHTPKYIFDALGCIFDVDVAAPSGGPRYVPAKTYLYRRALEIEWSPKIGASTFVWMNPPYGGRNGLRPWLDKFIVHGNGIALVPDRTSAPWFQQAAPLMSAVLFVSPKIKFEKDDGTLGVSPGCGSALFGMGTEALKAMRRAYKLGWLIDQTT